MVYALATWGREQKPSQPWRPIGGDGHLFSILYSLGSGGSTVYGGFSHRLELLGLCHCVVDRLDYCLSVGGLHAEGGG